MRHSTRGTNPPFAFDLHVLSTLPAFNLSQNQTLQFEIRSRVLGFRQRPKNLKDFPSLRYSVVNEPEVLSPGRTLYISPLPLPVKRFFEKIYFFIFSNALLGADALYKRFPHPRQDIPRNFFPPSFRAGRFI